MSDYSRLLWRCRRGMKEMDLLLERFLKERYRALSGEQQAVFERLLQEPDLDLYDWICGRRRPDDASYRSLVAELQRLSTH